MTVKPEESVIVSGGKYADAAAEDLKLHLELITGEKIPIMKAANVKEGAYVWRVGMAPMGDHGPFKPEEGRWLVTKEGTWFYGDTNVCNESMAKTGIDMAVYDFLEDELGTRWPWTTNIAFRARNPIIVKNTKGGWYPTIKLRAIRSRGRYEEWRARMRDGRHDVPRYGHAFGSYWKRFASTHQEFFGMRKDGKRLPPDAPSNLMNPAVYAGNMGTAISMCVSSDSLVDQVIADWCAKGTNEYVNICENDATGDNVCHCERCKALDEPRPADGHDWWINWYADRYVNFANRVLVKARKIRPDAKACFYGYNAMERAPLREKASEGLSVGLVPTVLTPEHISKYIKNWKKAGFTQFFHRPNRHHYYKTTPLVCGNEKYFFDIFKLVKSEDPVGYDYDSAGQNGIQEFFKDYVIYKGMQEPDKSFEYWEGHYMEAFGKAKEDVKAFYRYWRDVWTERLQPHVYEYTWKGFDFGRPFLTNLGKHYKSEDFEKAGMFLDHALAKSDLDPADRDRVEQLKDVNEHGKLFYEAVVHKSEVNTEKLRQFRKARGITLISYHENYYNDLCGMKKHLYKVAPEEIPEPVKKFDARRKARKEARAFRAKEEAAVKGK
ncbi:MAG: DUF4838 domain-containing protein [Kiritimatiellia bacterium]